MEDELQSRVNEVVNGIYQKIEEGFQIFLVHLGLGEVTVFLELLDAWKLEHNKKTALFTMANARTFLCSSCPAVDSLTEIDPIIYYALTGSPEFVGHTGLINFSTLHDNGAWNQYFGEDMEGKIKMFLGLRKTSKRRGFKLRFSDEDRTALEEFGKNSGADLSKIVLIVPDAWYFGNDVVSNDFWKKICGLLVNFGYIPFFNTSRDIVPGMPHAMWELKTVMLLADTCKKVIGVRTGLMDAIGAFTDARMYVIYPDDDNPIWEGRDRFKGPEKSIQYVEDGGSVSEKHRDEGVTELVHTSDDEDIELIMSDLLQHDRAASDE